MEQTLPVLNDPKKLEMLLNANDRRIRCRFDIAKKLYEQVIEQYPDDNEAYWCKLLCEYGIEYVEDDLTEKNIPTCHRTITESIFDNYDYRFIMSRATAEERAIYEAEAREIDRIQKDIIVHFIRCFQQLFQNRKSIAAGNGKGIKVKAHGRHNALQS